MSKDRLYLFDTTLRDGAQTAGIEFSLEDKIRIAGLLDELGVDYVEGGYPGANVVDDAFFAEPRTKRATFTAFGMTKRSGRSAGNDPGVQAILNSRAGAACFVAKASAHQVKMALGITPEENLTNLRETREGGGRRGQGSAGRLRALLRRLQGQPRLRDELRRDGAQGRRALGRAVRHQWRHDAVGSARDHRGAPGRQVTPRHPRP